MTLRSLARIAAALGLSAAAGAQVCTTELARLEPTVPPQSSAYKDDQFGNGAISGDTVAVAAHTTDHWVPPWFTYDVGAVYVFERDAGWVAPKVVYAQFHGIDDRFGISLDLEGDTLVVGADLDDNALGKDAGTAFVFERDQNGPGQWGRMANLVGSNTAKSDRFGAAVGLSGDTLAVSASWAALGTEPIVGAVYVFERNPSGAWVEDAILRPSDAVANMTFGRELDLDGDTLVVGASDPNALGLSTAAYVFERGSGGTWMETAKLVPTQSCITSQFQGVALSGDTLVLPSSGAATSGLACAGAVAVHERDLGGPGAWGLAAVLEPADPEAGTYFGQSLDLDGDVLVVGSSATHSSGANRRGAMYVFERDPIDPLAWNQAGRVVSSDLGKLTERFADSVAVEGQLALAGAPYKGPGGYAYLFEAPWITYGPPVRYCGAGTSGAGCVPNISASGRTSASDVSGFTLTVKQLEGLRNGMFVYGVNGRQSSPWGNGSSTLCVAPPLKRAGGLIGGGTAGSCNNVLSQDLNAYWCPSCPKANKNPGAGALVQAQLWYRDPTSTSNTPTNLSNAMEFCLVP